LAQRSRTVSQRADGSWANMKDGNERASSLHPRRREAQQEARRMLAADGGGELKVKGEDGKIRSKDTIPPA